MFLSYRLRVTTENRLGHKVGACVKHYSFSNKVKQVGKMNVGCSGIGKNNSVHIEGSKQYRK